MSSAFIRADLARSHAACERERSFAALAGFLPFLLIYVLVHTKYLRPYLPASRTGELVVLLLLPGVWCAVVLLLHRWRGPLGNRVYCHACGGPFIGPALERTLKAGGCTRCGAPLEPRRPR